MATQVTVIGGGPLGLMALKNFIEDGFDATLYESRAWVGGLWKYSRDDSLSTAENTIFNTSKFRTAISDFPVPEHMNDFPTAPQLHKYFESYCDHFNLWPHIKLNSPAKAIKRDGSRWAIEIEGEQPRTEYADKVALSTGPFVKPRKPDFEGIEQFQGKTVHAINFHDASQYKNQNLLVIGVHASSQDIISQLSGHSKKVYLSHRNGVVMLPQYSEDGSVYDRNPPLWFTILTLYLGQLMPSTFNWMMDSLVTSMANKGFPDRPLSLGTLATTKAPSVAVAPPLIASVLYPHFQSGFCEGVSEVKRIIGPKKVELKSGRVIDDIDTIVYCTGYHSLIPVDLEPADLQPYPYPGAPPNLYRNIFSLHPDSAIRNSIAFLGQVGIPFPGFTPHELVSQCVSQIWKGNSSLPSLAEMQRWHRDYTSWREDQVKQYNAGSTFYTVFLPMTDHIKWLDECAGLGMRQRFGLIERWTSPSAWRLWWNDRKLYNIVMSGITSPAIFRLFDQGKRKTWKGAREQIFVDNERVEQQQKARQKLIEEKKEV